MTLEDYVKDLYFAEVKYKSTDYFIDSLKYAQAEISNSILKKYSIENFNRFTIKSEQITNALDELKEFEYYEAQGETWDGLAKKVWEEFQRHYDTVNKAAFLQFRDRWADLYAHSLELYEYEDGYESLEDFFYEEVIPSGEADEALVSEVSLPKSIWVDLMRTNQVDVDTIFEDTGNLYGVVDFHRREEFNKICKTLGVDEDEMGGWDLMEDDIMGWENFDFYIDEVEVHFV